MTKLKKEQTVNLVFNTGNTRGKLFQDIISNLDNYSTTNTEIDSSANFNVFFNFSTFQSTKEVLLAELMSLNDKKTFTMFDISDENFLNIPEADYYILMAAAANFVTCSSEFIQESIFEHTGRLAYLVANPTDPEAFIDPSLVVGNKKPSVLWYGETRDIMSVRPYLTKNTHNIKIATTGHISNTDDRAETSILVSEEKKQEVLSQADVIYLPPTHNRQGEINRYKKVEESIKAGKFVIAPALDYDWDGLAKDCALGQGIQFLQDQESPNQYVTAKQDYLKRKYNKENVISALNTALELTPEDCYQENLEYLLNEEIQIL